jgi:C-terminal processing protease CtpA/Prc
MRAAVGLVGILICLGVVVWMLGTKGGILDHEKTVIDTGNRATEQVNQIAGRDSTTGEPANQSATLEMQQTNGRTDSILVTSLTADGAYAKFWGLKRNDLITEIGPIPVKGEAMNDKDASNSLLDAYQHRYQLVIMRDGQKMTLQPQDSTAKPAKSGDPLSNQLDAIQKIPTH